MLKIENVLNNHNRVDSKAMNKIKGINNQISEKQKKI